MMKSSTNSKVLATLVLLQMIYLVSFSHAYTFLIRNTKSQVQEDSCYDESLQINVPVNEERQRPGKCESIRCSDDYSLHGIGCGFFAVGPGMVLTKIDYSKPFPDCCPKAIKQTEQDLF
uniref:SVWC domain-containing protein n=1 Tax=Anopheles coluzzii TaxID=1518534 RepID=A0A6E8VZF1_ANOCL